MTRAGGKAAAIFCLLILLFFLFTTHALADTPEEIEKSLQNALPDDPAHPEIRDAAGDPERALSLVGADYLFSLALDSLTGEAPEALRVFLRLAGALLLLAVFTHLPVGTDADRTEAFVRRAAGLCLALLFYRVTSEDLTRATAALTDMRRFSEALAPVYAALFLAGGSAGTAAATGAGMAALSLFLETFCAGLLLPLLRLETALLLLSSVGGAGAVDGIARAVRTTYLTLLSFAGLLLTASLGFQTALSASADSLSVQSVRFALGNLIPVVGGTVGSAVRTLGASLSLLRHTAGAAAVAALLSLILPALLSLLLHRLCFSLAAALASAVGLSESEKLLSSFRSLYDLAAATLALASVIFLLLLALVGRCVPAISP